MLYLGCFLEDHVPFGHYFHLKVFKFVCLVLQIPLYWAPQGQGSVTFHLILSPKGDVCLAYQRGHSPPFLVPGHLPSAGELSALWSMWCSFTLLLHSCSIVWHSVCNSSRAMQGPMGLQNYHCSLDPVCKKLWPPRSARLPRGPWCVLLPSSYHGILCCLPWLQGAVR